MLHDISFLDNNLKVIPQHTREPHVEKSGFVHMAITIAQSRTLYILYIMYTVRRQMMHSCHVKLSAYQCDTSGVSKSPCLSYFQLCISGWIY